MSWKHKNDPEYVKKLAEGRRRYIESHHEVLSERIKKLNKALWKSPSFRKAHSERIKAKWRDPEYKKYMAGCSSKNLKALWKRPDFYKLLSELKSKELKERWKDEKSSPRHPPVEYYELQIRYDEMDEFGSQFGERRT